MVSVSEGRRTKAEGRRQTGAGASRPQKLSEILKDIDASSKRIETGIGELDRVLGGGLVPGEVVLLAGEPGMGKSTLLSRVALAMGSLVLYVCGEESPGQVALRLQRLSMVKIVKDGKDDSNLSNPSHPNHSDNLVLLSETNVDSIVASLERPGLFKKAGPFVAIVDSIQTLTTDDLTGVAGSVGQVRESAGRLMRAAKRLNVPIFLVGHVTKDGTVAGPKVLEHMVDAVLVLEGERSGNFRILRAVKNRFGAVDEVGLFAMDNGDMKEVVNPGELLLGEAAGKVSGSVLGCTLEGLRPLILEVQALAVPSKLAVPRRVCQGINERKLQVLCAVIERYISRKLGDMDIFVSIAGGLTSSDPGLDLAVVGAVISSLKDKKVEEVKKAEKVKNLSDLSSLSSLSSFIFCGEVGLLGEVRQVQGWERREKEVKRLGVGQLIGSNKIRNIRELSLSFLA